MWQQGKKEVAMWQFGIGRGCYVAARYGRRVQEEAPMWKQGV